MDSSPGSANYNSCATVAELQTVFSAENGNNSINLLGCCGDKWNNGYKLLIMGQVLYKNIAIITIQVHKGLFLLSTLQVFMKFLWEDLISSPILNISLMGKKNNVLQIK